MGIFLCFSIFLYIKYLHIYVIYIFLIFSEEIFRIRIIYSKNLLFEDYQCAFSNYFLKYLLLKQSILSLSTHKRASSTMFVIEHNFWHVC
jgi:hypothetical protein